MKKIFITGGTGFIGRSLKEQLAKRYLVFAPPHLELDLLEEDRVRGYLKLNCFDIVIHAATWNATRSSNKDIAKVLDFNCRMFFNLARCSEYYGKMIYYGSGAEYDMRHYIPKMPEEYFDTYVPIDDYGVSKYIMAKYTEKSLNIYDLRLFGVFGQYEDWEIRFISNACCKAVWDLPINIKQNAFFDYMYIDELVEITKYFIENNPKEKFYNVCTGRVFDLLTLARKILAVSGKDLELIIRQEGMAKEYSGDNSRLLKELGGYSFCDMDDCILKLYNWYAAHKNSIERQKLLYDK